MTEPKKVSRSGRTFILAAAAILLLPTLFRLFVIGRFDLGNDEAHYYMYAVHPALSYFDHPLMVALLIRAGMDLFGTTAFGVRVFAPLLFLLSSVLLGMIVIFLAPRRRVLLWTLILLNAIPLFGYLGSMLMLPDAPLSVFWLLYLLVAMILFGRYDRLSPTVRFQGWILLGSLFGLALLSKYNGVLLAPATFLVLAGIPRLRRLLLTPSPYLALMLGFLVAMPLFLWNLGNGGASFLFQATHGLGGIHFDWVPFYQMVFGQIGYVSPILFAVVVGVLWIVGRKGIESSGHPVSRDSVFLLVVFSLLPLLFFNAIGILHPILPHWPAMGYLGALPLVALLMADRPKSRISVWTVRGAWLGIAMALLVTIQLFFRPVVLPSRLPLWVDITNDLFGFRRLSAFLRDEMARHPGRLTTPFFFASEHFNTADEVAFYLDRPYNTICLSSGVTQFDFWTDPHTMIGKNGLFVSTDKYRVDPAVYYPKGTFDRVVPLSPLVIFRRGRPARIFYVYWLIGFRRVPFRPH